jgi:hypothetical protein
MMDVKNTQETPDERAMMDMIEIAVNRLSDAWTSGNTNASAVFVSGNAPRFEELDEPVVTGTLDRDDVHQERKLSVANPEQVREKEQWNSFMAEAAKQSRKKKRKISAAKNKKKREDKKENERVIQDWLNLYKRRHDSDDDYEDFNTAPVPYGAWGRVD